MVKVILDPGSCHMGKWDYIKELTDLAKEVGAEAIKWQLFKLPGLVMSSTGIKVPDTNGNIEFPRDRFKEAVDYARSVGLDVFASCFDLDAIDLVCSCGITKVKLAYSQNFNLKLIKKAKKLEMEIWASGDLKNYPWYADKKFFCKSEYPIKDYSPDWIFPSMWDGFSSHFLGWNAEKHFEAHKRFKYLEKHFTLDHDDIDVPDHWFALSPKELKEMMGVLK